MQFEQTQSIVSRIQQILREYPYGDAVLLELLQNADDAGATHIHAHLDASTKRSHNYAARSPAIEFFNNSVFTDRDLNNIQNIGGSADDSKRNDGTKVGRFGLGFNSAYHLSDVISFVSLGSLVVFDPSREFLPRNMSAGGVKVGGYRWNIAAEVKRIEEAQKKCAVSDLPEIDRFFLELLASFEDSESLKCATQTIFSPLASVRDDLPVFSRAASFKGTLFRLPLRATASSLWREVHSVEKLASLVRNFDDTARLGLVLTKHVCRMSSAITNADGSLVPCHFMESSGNSSETQRTKKKFVTWLEQYTEVMKEVAAAADAGNWSQSIAADLQEQLPQPETFFVKMSIRRTRFIESESRQLAPLTSSVEFIVSHFFGPGAGWQQSSSWTIAEECARYHHPISVPWSAVIVEGGGSLVRKGQLKQQGGRMLCFFPIRQDTGLPVHIHGYFQLTSDRQSVTSVDKSRWNASMCREVVPYAYASAIIARCVPTPSHSPLTLWPLGNFSDPTIGAIANHTIDLLSMQNTIPCKQLRPEQSITYQSLAKVRFIGVDQRELQKVQSASGNLTHSSASKAPLLPLMTPRAYAFLCKSLKSCDYVFVNDPDHEMALISELAVALKRLGHSIREADASYIRNGLTAVTDSNEENDVPNDVAVVLLCHCLSDVDFPKFMACEKKLPPLIPLATGRAGKLSQNLLYATEEGGWYDLCTVMPFAGRVVQNTERLSKPGLATETEDGDDNVDEAASWVFYLTACKKILQHFNKDGRVQSVTAQVFADELSTCLSPSGSLFKGNTTDGVRQWSLELQVPGCKNVALIDHKQVRMLSSLLDTTFDPSAYLTLRILPSMTNCATDTRRCVSANEALCIACDVTAGASTTEAMLFDLLSRTGAIPIDTSVFPITLLQKWRGSARPTPLVMPPGSRNNRSADDSRADDDVRRVVVIGSTHKNQSAKDVVFALKELLATVPDAAKTLTALLTEPMLTDADASAGGTLKADALREFFAASRESLTVSDLKFVAALPIFRTIWGNLVPLQQVGRGDDKSTVFRLPTGLNPVVVKSLRNAPFDANSIASVTFGCRHQLPDAVKLLERLSILEEATNADERIFLSTVLQVQVLPPMAALTLSVCRLPPPPPVAIGAPPDKDYQQLDDDARACVKVWHECFAMMHATYTSKQEVTDMLRAALLLVAHVPMLPSLLPNEEGSGRAKRQLLTAPIDTVASASAELAALLIAVERNPATKGRSQQQVPRMASLDVIPTVHRESVVALLHIAKCVDGDSLVALAEAVANGQFLDTERSSLADGGLPEPSDACLAFAAAVLDCLEHSRDLSASQWSAVAAMNIVPCFASGKAVLHDSSSDSGVPKAVLVPPTRACVMTVHRLCPISARCPIHPSLSKGTSSSSSTNAFPFPQLLNRFGWGTPPPFPDVLHYVEWCARPVSKIVVDTSARLVSDDPRRHVHCAYEHIEAQLGVLHRRGMITTVGNSSGASSLPDGLDPFLLQPNAIETIQRHLKRLFFPEKCDTSFAVEQLSFDAQADQCFPFLATVDKSTAVRLQRLLALMHIVPIHSGAYLTEVLTKILSSQLWDDARKEPRPDHGEAKQQTTKKAAHVDPAQQQAPLKGDPLVQYCGVVQLDEAARVKYVKCLEYLVSSDPNLALQLGREGKLAVPTADGSVHFTTKVHYNVFTTEKTQSEGQAEAAGGPPQQEAETQEDLLHSIVSSTIAKALGIKHAGIKFLAQMNPKYGRSAFRAKGQRQSVTNAIKRILNDYSDQQSILMEMIQNADDALANEVVFYMDHRRFDKAPGGAADVAEEGLLGKEMRRCQGPSLVVYNDKMFMPSDFDAILEIGCGHKSKDQLSIGRFGVGFNSVYHLTDCPVIISGDHTLFLDPAAAHVESASPDAPGVMIEHTQEPALTRHFPAQFAPFARYKVDFRRKFPGTLFRLPLRSKPWEHSVSSASWSASDVLKMFHQFHSLTPHVLLFLKHVRRIALIEISHDGKEEHCISEVVIRNREPVYHFREHAQNYAALQHPQKPVMPSHNDSCVFHVSVHEDDNRRQQNYSWLVSTSIQSIASGPPLKCDAELRRKLIPWGTVAILLNQNNAIPSPQTSTPSASAASVLGLLTGLRHDTSQPQAANVPVEKRMLFQRCAASMTHCFLPLPCVKGELPFHIHGCFALTSDRRGMWTQSIGDEDSWEVVWNKFILSEMVADAAVRAFASHATLHSAQEEENYYDSWPLTSNSRQSASVSTDTLRYLSLGFFKKVFLLKGSLLWSLGRVFVSPDKACCSLMHGAAGGGRRHGGQPDNAAMMTSSLPYQLRDEVASLVLNDEHLCFVPPQVYYGFVSASTELCEEPPDELCPRKIAKELDRRTGTSTSYCVAFATVFPSYVERQRQGKAVDPPFQVLAEVTVYLAQAKDDELLNGLPLVLLQDGTVGIVSREAGATASGTAGVATQLVPSATTGRAATVFIAPSFAREVEKLFPAVPVVDERFYNGVAHVARKASTATHGQSSSTAAALQFTPQRWTALCVEPLSINTISRFFHLHAREETHREIKLGSYLHLDSGFQSSPLHRWCLAFWQFVRKGEAGVVLDQKTLAQCSDLARWPLIPARRAGEHVLVPMQECSLLVCGTTQAIVYDALEHLGVWALDTEFEEWQTIRVKCGVVDIEGQKIGDLLEEAVRQGRFLTMGDAQRERMLQWLLQSNDSQKGFLRSMLGGSGPLVQSIRRLPLFLKYDGAARKFAYHPIPDGGASFAIPDDVPLSPLCDGLFKKAIPTLQLMTMPMTDFLTRKVSSAVTAVETVPPHPMELTAVEELEHLRLLARFFDNNIKSYFEKLCFVPGESSPGMVQKRRRERASGSSATVASPGALRLDTLRRLSAEWVADADIDVSWLQGHNDQLLAVIKAVKLDHLDRSKRHLPSSIVRPVLCKGAAVPHVLPLLMQAAPELFTKVMCPTVLWEDGLIQELLIKLGVAQRLDSAVLKEAATAVVDLCKNNIKGLYDCNNITAKAHDLGDELRRHQQHQSKLSKQRIFVQNISWSLAQCVLELSVGAAALEAVSTIPFVFADPLEELPNSISAVTASALNSNKGPHHDYTPNLYAPIDMAPSRYKFAVWSHRPVLPQAFDGLFPATAKVPVGDILQQLRSVISEFRGGSPSVAAVIPEDLANRSISTIYEILASDYRTGVSEGPPNEALRCEKLVVVPIGNHERNAILSKECRFIPPAGQAIETVTFDQIIAVGGSANVGTLRPHFYHAREFECSPPLSALLYAISPKMSFGLPTIESVLGAIASYSAPNLTTENNTVVLSGAQLVTYVELLKLLVVCCDYNAVILLPPVFNDDGTEIMRPLRTTPTQAAAAPAALPRRIGSYVLMTALKKRTSGGTGGTLSTAELPIPDTDGALIPICNGIALGDNPSQLRRVRPGSISISHSLIPLAVARSLGVPSLARVLQEEPRSVASIQNLPTEYRDQQRRCHMFFRTPMFRRVLVRLLTHSTALASHQGRPNDLQPFQDSTTASSLFTPDELRHLNNLRVRFVGCITVLISHRNRPGVNISSGDESPPVAFDLRRSTIFISCGTRASYGDAINVVKGIVDPLYLIAMSINRLLRERIQNLAPLCCVLQCVTTDTWPAQSNPLSRGHATSQQRRHNMSLVTQGILDVFDCSDVSSHARQQQQPDTQVGQHPPSYVVLPNALESRRDGEVVDEYVIMKYGRMRLAPPLIEGAVQPQPSANRPRPIVVHAVLDTHQGLWRWKSLSGVANSSLCMEIVCCD